MWSEVEGGALAGGGRVGTVRGRFWHKPSSGDSGNGSGQDGQRLGVRDSVVCTISVRSVGSRELGGIVETALSARRCPGTKAE